MKNSHLTAYGYLGVLLYVMVLKGPLKGAGWLIRDGVDRFVKPALEDVNDWVNWIIGKVFDELGDIFDITADVSVSMTSGTMPSGGLLEPPKKMKIPAVPVMHPHICGNGCSKCSFNGKACIKCRSEYTLIVDNGKCILELQRTTITEMRIMNAGKRSQTAFRAAMKVKNTVIRPANQTFVI